MKWDKYHFISSPINIVFCYIFLSYCTYLVYFLYSSTFKTCFLYKPGRSRALRQEIMLWVSPYLSSWQLRPSSGTPACVWAAPRQSWLAECWVCSPWWARHYPPPGHSYEPMSVNQVRGQCGLNLMLHVKEEQIENKRMRRGGEKEKCTKE